MSCDDKRQAITAYFDGELDRDSALDLERHLEHCPACAQSLAAQRALRDSIQAAALRYEPTRAQTRRLQGALRRAAIESGGAAESAGAAESRVPIESGAAAEYAAAARSGDVPNSGAAGAFATADSAAGSRYGVAAKSGAATRSGDAGTYRAAPSWPWHLFRTFPPAWRGQRLEAIAALLLVAALSFSLGRAWPPRAADPAAALTQEVVSSHVRSLLAGRPADVVSSDRHTVKPWFTGKLDYAPQVLDLASQGFPLAGGRLDYLDRHPVAALVYRAGPHTINLFTWPATPGPAGPPAAGIERGFHLLHWTQSGMTYWAVSDVAPDRLQDFAQRLRAELARAAS